MPATKTRTAPVEPALDLDTNHAAEPAELPLAEDGAAILALDDRQTEVVAIPEWGMRVIIQSLTGDERDEVDEWITTHRGEAGEVKQTGFRAFLVAMTAVNSKGDLLFTAEQAEALGRKNHQALVRLASTALRLSKMNQGDVDEAAEDLGKDQSSDSGSR